MEQLQFARRAAKALEISFSRSAPIIKIFHANSSQELDITQEEVLEALTSRFARLADIILQKVVRALDAIELTDSGSILDRLSRMEKRQLIPDMQNWVKMREIRNEIADEYTAENLRGLQQEVYAAVPELLSGLTAIESYAKQKAFIFKAK